MVQVEGFGLISSKKNIFGFRPFLNDFFLKMLVFLAILGYVAYTLSKREHLKNPPVTPMAPLWPHVTPMTLFDPPWPHMTSMTSFYQKISNQLYDPMWQLIWPPWPHFDLILTPMTSFDLHDATMRTWPNFKKSQKYTSIGQYWTQKKSLVKYSKHSSGRGHKWPLPALGMFGIFHSGCFPCPLSRNINLGKASCNISLNCTVFCT